MTLCPPKSYMCASASLIDEIVRLPKPAFRWPQIQGIPSHIDPSSCLCNGLIQPSPRPRRERVICTTGTTTWMRPSRSCRRLKLGKADMVHLMVGAGKISEDISLHEKVALMAFCKPGRSLRAVKSLLTPGHTQSLPTRHSRAPSSALGSRLTKKSPLMFRSYRLREKQQRRT